MGRHGKSIIPFLGKVFLGSAQVLSVDYRKDDFNEIVLYNECSLYLVGEDTLTVGYWCPPLIWGGMWFLLRRYTRKLEKLLIPYTRFQ